MKGGRGGGQRMILYGKTVTNPCDILEESKQKHFEQNSNQALARQDDDRSSKDIYQL